MDIWLIAATALLFGTIPCGFVCIRARLIEAVAALQPFGTIDTLVLLLLAEGFGRPPFFDLAIVLAFLGFGGTLAFARFLERDI